MDPQLHGRVLIIDDQPDIRLCLRYILEAEGYDVVGEADDARSGMDLALTLAPDIIVLDVLLPELSGLDALPHLRRVAPMAKIVMHSALAGKHRRWAEEAGADGYVDKTDIIKIGPTLHRLLRGEETSTFP